MLHVESQDYFAYLQPYQRPGGVSVFCTSESIAIAFVSLQPDPHMLQFRIPIDRETVSTTKIARINRWRMPPCLHFIQNSRKIAYAVYPYCPDSHRIEGNKSVLAYSECCRAPSNKDQRVQSPMYTPTRRLANYRFKTLANGQKIHTPIQPPSTMAQLVLRKPKCISARG